MLTFPISQLLVSLLFVAEINHYSFFNFLLFYINSCTVTQMLITYVRTLQIATISITYLIKHCHKFVWNILANNNNNIARGEAECYICHETLTKCCIFHTNKAVQCFKWFIVFYPYLLNKQFIKMCQSTHLWNKQMVFFNKNMSVCITTLLFYNYLYLPVHGQIKEAARAPGKNILQLSNCTSCNCNMV